MAHLRLLELDGQQAVLETVAAKNVGEARGDHGAEAVVLERPRRVLAGGAAAEVAPGDQDAAASVGRVVELEIGIERSVFAEAPVIEEELAEAGPLDPLQELLRDDLVGVDVDAVERGEDAGVANERLHLVLLFGEVPAADVDEVPGD